MENHDLQAVCNIYQVPVHILTTGVVGMAEPRARWTHLQPDIRLKEFCKIVGDLPEMWLLHQDNIHCDLIINRESILAKEGSIQQTGKEGTDDIINKDGFDTNTK